jgi:hypothetical protein
VLRDVYPGSTVDIQVRGQSQIGDGSWSGVVTFQADPPRPPEQVDPVYRGAPVAGITASRQIVITWPEPYTHGLGITKYNVETWADWAAYHSGAASLASDDINCGASCTASHITVLGWDLGDNVTRVFKVKAQTMGGWGVASAPHAFQSGLGDPPQKILGIQKTNPFACGSTYECNYMGLSWEHPSGSGYELIEYEVNYQWNETHPGTSKFTSGQNAYTGCVGPFEHSTPVPFRVRARNMIGWAEWSSDVTYWTGELLPPEKPSQPSRIIGAGADAVTSVMLRVSISANCLNYPITGEVEVNGPHAGPYEQITINPNCGTTHTFTGLTPGTPQRYRLRGSNEAGTGSWSDAITYTTSSLEPGGCEAPYASYLNRTIITRSGRLRRSSGGWMSSSTRSR